MAKISKSKIITYSVASAVAVVLTVAMAAGFGAFNASSASLAFAYLCNASFIVAVLYCGIGGLSWIASTGLFDIFGYGFKSLKYLFTPLKRDEDDTGYYEYVMKKREDAKNKPVPYFLLIIGLVVLAVSLIFLALWNYTGAVDMPY